MIQDSVRVWKELSSLYEEADALDDVDLANFLQVLEAQGNPLLTSLRRMLNARSSVAENDFLGRAPSLPIAPEIDPLRWQTGTGVGPYRLVRHLGSGGMAEVWLAERADGAFERTVAIKLLFDHPSRARRENFVERFKRERDILAGLDHPRIARLHDAGVTPTGQSWLALEAVDGEMITKWCDRERLTVEQRVRLFREVLDAVEHAHARLVIHRDIKPSNVLVGKDGTVRLLDFGISKLLEVQGQAQGDTALTQHGGRPLTPEYASPEQKRGDPLTTACDIYSLGVLLHELLVGERPHFAREDEKGGSMASLFDAHSALPSRTTVSSACLAHRNVDAAGLKRALRPDLDAIVLKSIEPSPERRYESVGAMRADLDRWLSHRPVLATVPSRLYRLAKFARRNRVSLALGTAVAVVLVVSLATTFWQGARAQREGARALVVKQFLLDMFRLSDPNANQGGSIAASEMLDAGLARANSTLGSEPRLHAEVLGGIAEIEQHLGRYVQADAILRQAEAIYAGLSEQREATAVRIELADNALRMGQLDRVATMLTAVRPDLEALRSDRALQARSEEVAGWLARSQGDLVAARQHMSAQLEHAVAAYGAHDNRTADAWRGLADVESQTANYDAAMRDIDAAQAAASGAANVTATDRIGIEGESARIALVAGWYAKAQIRIESALQHCGAVLGVGNEDCFVLRQLKVLSLLQMGKSREAFDLLPIFERMADDDQSPAQQAEAVVSAARLLAANGQFSSHIDIVAKLKALAHPSGNESLNASAMPARFALAEAALREGRIDDAERELADMLNNVVTDGGKTWRSRALVLHGLAVQSQGRHTDALVALEAAAALLGELSGASHPNVTVARLYEVPSLLALGERARALEIAEQADAALRARLPADAPLLAKVGIITAELRNPAGSPFRAARRAVFFNERSP